MGTRASRKLFTEYFARTLDLAKTMDATHWNEDETAEFMESEEGMAMLLEEYSKQAAPFDTIPRGLILRTVLTIMNDEDAFTTTRLAACRLLLSELGENATASDGATAANEFLKAAFENNRG